MVSTPHAPASQPLFLEADRARITSSDLLEIESESTIRHASAGITSFGVLRNSAQHEDVPEGEEARNNKVIRASLSPGSKRNSVQPHSDMTREALMPGQIKEGLVSARSINAMMRSVT
jgi:hypothetical protein